MPAAPWPVARRSSAVKARSHATISSPRTKPAGIFRGRFRRSWTLMVFIGDRNGGPPAREGLPRDRSQGESRRLRNRFRPSGAPARGNSPVGAVAALRTRSFDRRVLFPLAREVGRRAGQAVRAAKAVDRRTALRGARRVGSRRLTAPHPSPLREGTGQGEGKTPHPIAILRGCACLAFGKVKVSTPSSRLALIFSWSTALPSVKERA